MRAVRVEQLGSIGNGTLMEVPDPIAGPGQVVLQVEAVAVNFVDIVTITGRYQFTPQLPYTPGKGPAGTVLEVGPGVDRLRPGDRILAMAEYGGYAERAVVDQEHCHLLPDSVSATDAAAMAVAFDTAWMALVDRAQMQPGESVLILGGSGAVGQAAIELARAMGAGVVLTSASSPQRVPPQFRDAPRGVIDLSRGDLRDSVRSQVHAVLPEGVDIVIDTLGGDAFDGAIRSLAWRGRIVSIGYAAGRIPTLKVNYLLLKNISASGLQISDYRRRLPDLVDRAFGEIFMHVVEGRVSPPAVETLPLEEWETALDRLDRREAERRLVLTPTIGPAGTTS